jgi:uncharacterized membrane protein YphA (DoxX/SURF4 family)
MNAHAIEHGSSRSGRWLRGRRLRLTAWITAVEGLLYLIGVLHWWAAVVLALIAVAFYWFVGRSSRSYTVRQASWIFAASQLLVLCVPLAIGVFKLIAIGLIAIAAVVGLFLLFSERS